MRSVLVVLILAVIAGCADNTSSNGGTTSNTETKVYGLAANDYYNQFLFRTSETRGIKHYHYLAMEDVVIRGEGVGSLRAGGSLYLREDNTFQFLYSEREVTSKENGYYSFKLIHKSCVQGKWSIQGLNLVLTGLATGSGLKVNDVHTVIQKFEREINSAGLNGKSSIFGMIESNSYGRCE